MKFNGIKHDNMLTIERIGRKDVIILLDTRIEGINYISTNFIYTNWMKPILYDTPIVFRLLTKNYRSIVAACIILPIQLKEAPSINTRFDIML
jgi:hypothetical protein